MKKFSKILVLVLALALIVGACFAFAACNDNDSSTGNRKINMLNVELSSEQYAFIFKKSDTELKEQVNQILADKATEVQAIIDKYLNASADELMSFGSVIKTEATGAADELVVATNAEFAPFEYFQGAYFAGIDMHIAQLFADALDKTLVIRHMKFESVIPTVAGTDYAGDSEDGTAEPPDGIQADIGMAGLTVTPKRAEAVSFTDSYYNAAQRVAVLTEDTAFDECQTKADVVAVLNTLTGEVAGAATGQTGYTYLAGDNSGTMGEDFKGFADVFSEIKQYNSIGLAVQDLAGERLRVVVGDKFTLAEAVNGING